MIKKLKLTNLQSHTESELDCHPGVNVILGPSDVGKSAIIRGLKWVALNKPAGDGLRRHKTKETRVELDGVTKVKTKSKHHYELEGKTFKAIRSNVPDEISDHLRLTAENFQEQHDAYFLISDPPGQVAKTLNQVADLEIIDLSIQSVKQKVREAKSNKKFYEEELAIQHGKIDALAWVINADGDLRNIEEMEAQAEAIDVDGLLGKISDAESLSLSLENFPDITNDIQKIVSTCELLTRLDLSASTLIDSVEKNQVFFPVVSGDIEELDFVTEKLRKDDVTDLNHMLEVAWAFEFEADQFPKTIDDPTETLVGLVEFTAEVVKLEELVMEAFVAEDCSEAAHEAYGFGVDDYDLKIRAVGVCPLCESELQHGKC